MEPISKYGLLAGIILLVNNLIMFIILKAGTNIIINILVPAIILILSLIKKDNIKKIIIAVAFFMVGGFVAFGGTVDNFSAISLFVIFCFIIRNKRVYIISGLLLFFLTLINFSINNYPLPNFVNMINAYVFIGYVSVSLFWPVSELRSKQAHSNGLTPEQIATIEMLQKGVKHKDAAEQLNIERKTYSARVSSLRKRYGVDNDFQLAIVLIKDDVIGLNSLAKAKTEE